MPLGYGVENTGWRSPTAQMQMDTNLQGQGFQIEVNYRRDVERNELREQQTAHHRQTQRLARVGALAVAERDRQSAESAAMVVIMIGRKRRMTPGIDGVGAYLPSMRWASMAKSIIMIAFFFTTPNSMMSPTNAYRSRSLWKIFSVSSAPKTAEGNPERMVMG